jgi:membrane protein
MKLKKRFIRHAGRAYVAAGRNMLTPEVPRDAAGISYFGLLVLIPAILVLISLVDAFLGWMNLHNIVLQQIVNLFPGSRQFLKSNLNELRTPSAAIVVSCIVVVVWSSSWIFTFIESAVNRAWGVSHQRTFWESRLRSIALMLLGGFSLLCSAAITAFVSAAREQTDARIAPYIRESYFIGWFWSFILLGAGLLIAVLVFALVFKWIPHRKVLWKEAFPGALVSTIMWEIGSLIFVKLVPFFDYQRIYGRMGAVIALLVWVYTSSLIFIFGAHFSAQFHWTKADMPIPDSGPIEDEKLPRAPSLR